MLLEFIDLVAIFSLSIFIPCIIFKYILKFKNEFISFCILSSSFFISFNCLYSRNIIEFLCWEIVFIFLCYIKFKNIKG